MTDKTRITVFADGEHVEKLNRLTKQAGISKNAWLASTLAAEVDYLRRLQVNGQKARNWFKALGKIRQGNSRLNITLERADAELISSICEEKGISRDQFISEYIAFLVNGDPDGTCDSPLEKVVAMLRDPRYEYYETNGGNPYEDLHLTEEDVDELYEHLRKVVKEGQGDERDAL